MNCCRQISSQQQQQQKQNQLKSLLSDGKMHLFFVMKRWRRAYISGNHKWAKSPFQRNTIWYLYEGACIGYCYLHIYTWNGCRSRLCLCWMQLPFIGLDVDFGESGREWVTEWERTKKGKNQKCNRVENENNTGRFLSLGNPFHVHLFTWSEYPNRKFLFLSLSLSFLSPHVIRNYSIHIHRVAVTFMLLNMFNLGIWIL